MTHPYSDTSSPSETKPMEWDQAAALSKRLGLPVDRHPGRWSALMFTALHALLDRVEALEGGQAPQK